MRCFKGTSRSANVTAVILLLAIPEIYTLTIKDVFTSTESLVRVPRESKYPARYGSSGDTPLSRTLKPEETPEAREDALGTSVGKRCIRCDSGYYDRYDTKRYDDRDRRRGYDDRYDRYDDRDRYDRDRYDKYDRYDRDRYDSRDRDRYYYDRRYDDYDRYDRDRYDVGRYDRDRYDRGRDRYDYRDRYYDRGVGYDNRGYDTRDRYDRDREGYRPWDETYRGVSGFDTSGRGYYFASSRPDTYGGGYASSWSYGGGRNDYRDRNLATSQLLSVIPSRRKNETTK
ncbi:uncharacterized protein LOC109600611 isoform X2 [Aethina tumida]|uniref:uncharacterized protein LOC109600611 isoform X2 n=1 Tax=Aethina tumida TaxID=116153 RepID=UPI00096B5684|nr:uncharacterized protein LOC109600611 isoform X2 [Aethina tumida]